MAALDLEGSVLKFNNKPIGIIYKDADGYYVFEPDCNCGFYDEYGLRLIANYLEELNKPLNESLKEYFKNDN